jgi:hypothetical protein
MLRIGDLAFNETARVLPVAATSDIPPEQTFFLDTEPIVLKPEVVEKLKHTDTSIVVAGVVLYSDIVDKPHRTEWCVYYFGNPRIYDFCPTHNVSR